MKTVIFDVDGVLLSEKRYFDVSGLVLWEWYNSPLFLGIGEEPVIAEPTEEKIEALRRHYWADDELLRRFKRHGINSNWDMVYLFAVCSFLVAAQGDANLFRGLSADFSTSPALRKLGTALRRRAFAVPSGRRVLDLFETLVPEDTKKDDVFFLVDKALSGATAAVFAGQLGLHGTLWQSLFACFQNWYLGDAFYAETYGRKPDSPGKAGFLTREVPLGGAAETKAMFIELKRRGYAIAVGTGRAAKEVEIPFAACGWLDEFDVRHIATATDIEKAEKQLGRALDKPNPFVYYAGAFGRYEKCYRDYIDHPDRYKQGIYYIIGDSPADIRCAKAMGAVMIAVLTGLEGEGARPLFEREKADYIVSSLLDILPLLP